MTQQHINIGTAEQTGDGESIRSAFSKIEDNFTDLYTDVAANAQAAIEVNDLTSSVTWANVPDANITQSSVTQHQASLALTASQVSDFVSVVQENEINDLTGTVTWANVPDANITESSVTQHQEALAITLSQITDIGSNIFLTNIQNESIGDLSDVDLTGIANGSILSWNSTSGKFEIASIAGGIQLTSLSVTAPAEAFGSGGVDYNNVSGTFTYTPPDLSTYLTAESDTFQTVTSRGSTTTNTVDFQSGVIATAVSSSNAALHSIGFNEANPMGIGSTIGVNIVGGAGAPINIGTSPSGTVTIGSGSNTIDYAPGTTVDFTGATITGLTLDGDVTGSVFADNSTVMVDGVSATLNFVNNDTDDLAEGSTNLYYTDARAQAAIGSGLADPEYHSGAIIDLIGDGGDFFKREVTVNGVRIVAAGAVGGQTAVPDAFVEKVARMFELFTDPNGAGINEASQRTFIKTLSGDSGTYHAAVGPTLQRVARGAGSDYSTNFLTDDGITFWNLSPLFDSHVANDMVWYLNSTGDAPGDGDNDAQEVIEHVFHTLHMHGLDAVSLKMYPYISADWASGPLYAAMEEAYDAGKWDSSGYGGNAWKTDGDAFEVAAKEYLFLLNFGMFEYSSLWDGGSLSPEWTDDMRTQSGIQANNPLGYALHNTYIAPVISKPSLTTIRSIFQDGDVGDPSIAGSSGYTVDTESSEVEYYPTTGAFTVNTTFANLKTTPTTIAGYGINDAYTKAEVDAIIESPSGNLTGSVFADDSTLLVDGVAGKIVGDYTNGSSTIGSTRVESYDINALQDTNTIDSYVAGTIYGGETGNIKNLVVGSTAPSTSNGAANDRSGMIAFDSTYIYYCTADYTDGVADIWKRIAWSGDTW
jgi:hypothetical protein